VLCGLSALMEYGPDLVEDIRLADPEYVSPEQRQGGAS
jgi:hypothetical protein